MDWLNLHTSTLDSDEFLGSEPVERATWICLLRYCIGQENGGRIVGAADWADRKWQQIARVTKREATASCALWSFDGLDLIVWAYPIEREIEIKKNREDGKRGGRPKGSGSRNRNPPVCPEEPPGETEGERKGKGKEGEGESAQARESPPPDETPEWKLNKAEAYRREIADHRTVVQRLEPNEGKLAWQAREKLEKARAEIRDIETKIFGLGLRP